MRLALPFCLIALLCAAPAAVAGERAGGVPPGKTVVVVGQSGAGPADALEAATQVRPAGAMWYLGLYEEPADVQAVLDDIAQAVEQRPGLIVNVGVSFGSASTPSPPYTGAIAAGAYDDRIDLLAAALKRLPTVAHLRLGYEFDLLGGQYGPPEVYKAAFRHVADRLDGAGVRNASYVWHSAGAFWRATDPSFFAVSSGTLAQTLRDAPLPARGDVQPIAAFYPGRQYVDAFAISYWQDSCCFGRSGEQARAIYEARTREILDEARALGLPLQIGESTPVYVGADSGADSVRWLDNAFRLIEDYDIGMWSLIAIDWQQGGFFAAPFWNGYWPDARIGRYAATRERYLDGVRGERFLHRTPELPQRLGLRP